MNLKSSQRVKVEFIENIYLNSNFFQKKHNESLNCNDKPLQDITPNMLSNTNSETEQQFDVVDKNKKTNIKENSFVNDHCYIRAMEKETKIAIKKEAIAEEIDSTKEEPTKSGKNIKTIQVSDTEYIIIHEQQISKLKHKASIKEENLISIKVEATTSIKEEEPKETIIEENIVSFTNDDGMKCNVDNDDDDMKGEKGDMKGEEDEGEEKEQMINDKGEEELYDESQENMEDIYILPDDIEGINVEQHNDYETFSKESLQTKLLAIFRSREEIKTADGTVIDKDIIMDSFNGLLDTNTMKNLWASIHGIKKKLCPDLLTILHAIQIKYEKDAECKIVFDIEYLDTDEKIAAEFDQRKLYGCYLYADYRCEICYQGFKHEKQLDNHYMKGHHESVGDIVCDICSLRYKKRGDLLKHIAMAHRAVYKCKMCPLVTYYRYTMINHCDQHLGKEYKCELCHLTYKSKSALNTHITSRHRCGLNICSVCGKRFASPRTLSWHRKKEHPDEPKTRDYYTCPPCSLVFTNETAYLEHSIKKHDGFLCGTEKSTEDERNKKNRENKQKRLMKKPQTCRVCNKTGIKNGWLNRHFLIDHPTLNIHEIYADTKEYLCHICPKGFKLPCMLRDHVNTHTGLRPYACDYCPKRFHSRSAVTCHRQWHFPPTHECQVCKKMFHTGTNLSNHMRTHIGDRRYRCEECNKGFLHSGSLNEHIKGVHQHVRRIKKRKKTIAEKKMELEEEDSDDGSAEYLDLSMLV